MIVLIHFSLIYSHIYSLNANIFLPEFVVT